VIQRLHFAPSVGRPVAIKAPEEICYDVIDVDELQFGRGIMDR
jgi:hypothetical protein